MARTCSSIDAYTVAGSGGVVGEEVAAGVRLGVGDGLVVGLGDGTEGPQPEMTARPTIPARRRRATVRGRAAGDGNIGGIVARGTRPGRSAGGTSFHVSLS
jgi:hypothetical protein